MESFGTLVLTTMSKTANFANVRNFGNSEVREKMTVAKDVFNLALAERLGIQGWKDLQVIVNHPDRSDTEKMQEAVSYLKGYLAGREEVKGFPCDDEMNKIWDIIQQVQKENAS
jgi:hypothetical protein